MSELYEATKVLINSPVRSRNQIIDEEQKNNSLNFSLTEPLQPPWSIPQHLINQPEPTRDAALRATESGLAARRSPHDYDLILQHGLRLQELASLLPQSQSQDQITLLHSACEVYGRANDTRHSRASVVLFNWAVALSDIARLVRTADPGEAAEYLSTAALKYGAALSIDRNNPQALNNWGLVLQDLAGLMPQGTARQQLLIPAIHRFRAAVRLQPNFRLTSRFSYNLGTVLYAYAYSIADAPPHNTSNTASTPDMQHNQQQQRARGVFASAAQYIALAYALQPDTKIYYDSMKAVQKLLPLPYLRAGPLKVVVPGTEDSPMESWTDAWFALDGLVMQSVRPPPSEAHRIKGSIPILCIDVSAITTVHACQDPSLPSPGWGLWLALKGRPNGIFLVAESEEESQCWIDALRVLGMLSKGSSSSGGGDSHDDGVECLQQALMVVRRRQSGAE